MEQGKLASRELAVQKRMAALVVRLCGAFGVAPPVLSPFKPKYATRGKALLRNEAVANALASIVDTVAPAETLTSEEVMAPTETPEAPDPSPVDDELESLAGDIDAALGGSDFIPEGGDGDGDHIVDATKKVLAKPAKRKGFRS